MTKYLVLLLVAVAFQSGDTLQCYTCDSATNPCGPDLPIGHSTTEICKDNDTCYSTLKDNGRFARGCMKDDECIKDSNCLNCDKDFCNRRAYKPLECFACSSDTHANCGYDFEPDSVPKNRACNADSSIDFCFTAMDPEKNLILRGCNQGGSLTSVEWEKCDSSLCNGGSKSDDVNCFKCDPIRNTECADDTVKNADNMTVNCGKVFKDPLCYKTTLYGLAYRGCAAKNTTQVCRKPGLDTCDLCNTDKCNSSSELAPSFLVYLLVPIITAIYRYQS